ncbi:mRNA export factor GLE1 [Girardinichthys multiradiatus]|uniref:mRNA export factor GLE1 n=1 Tax=Girardinichthys multiradiatus TaxID=208333 RepID=UPI001FAC9A8D|nr:mRNA export factor GLE1 [Girardinichthys multiradiatus]
MPSENLRWKTLEGLKNSPKGQVTFDPYWSERGEHILAGCKETLSLSSHSAVILEQIDSKSLHKSSFLDSSSADSEESPASVSCSASTADLNGKLTTLSSAPSLKDQQKDISGLLPKLNVLQAVSDETRDESPEADISEVSSPSPPPAISLLSPKAMEMAGHIIRFEEDQREKAKMALRERQAKQEKLVESVASDKLEHLKRFEELRELKQRQEFQSIRDMMDRETKEIMGRHEKLKEEQRHRIKIQNLRLRELEQQRLREVEQEKQRQAEGRERLRSLNSIQEEILQINQLLELSGQTGSDLPAASLTSYSSRGNQLCSQVSEVVRKTAEGEFPSLEDMTVAERALCDMRLAIRQMEEEAARVREKKKEEQEQEEERRKQEAMQAQQEAQKKAEQAAKEKAQKKGLQNSAEESTMKWYKELQDSAARCTQSFEQLSTPKDPQTKKLKLELQKAATIPVSQISTNSGSQLREIFDKIDKLLSGRAVVSGGKSVSASQHPQGLEFVGCKLAEKFVKQGEEEVASHHEAAFPIAVVASGIWELHPQVGDLILAHLHKKCPYAVPHYPPMKDGTSVEEYQKILGYRVDDSGVEGQDSFLKRMSGMIRLYAAVIQLRWPYGTKQGAVSHGLNHGWRWLAQMLNMEPLADITATLLFDFLEVCGNALMKQYQGQFWKLILLLKDEYFPRIEAVTSSGQMGSVIRLKQFLETSLQSRQISPPKGQLSSTFWRS